MSGDKCSEVLCLCECEGDRCRTPPYEHCNIVSREEYESVYKHCNIVSREEYTSVYKDNILNSLHFSQTLIERLSNVVKLDSLSDIKLEHYRLCEFVKLYECLITLLDNNPKN